MNNIKKLYDNISKHSHYQILPKSVENLIGAVKPNIFRYEFERFNYINKKVDFDKKSILDIGANTGFFSISSLENNANDVVVYEGNNEHCNFIKNVCDILNLNIDVKNEYFTTNTQLNDTFDITFLLNIVHHLGDDFDDNELSMPLAKNKMIEFVNTLSNKTKYLIFQMGYCWKGDVNQILFDNGTKSEMISFIETNTSEHWIVESIGIMDTDMQYYDVNNSNLLKIQQLKEFGNRPLFILKSKNI
jgi:uncharacterized protein related to proFAR isomerase